MVYRVTLLKNNKNFNCFCFALPSQSPIAFVFLLIFFFFFGFAVPSSGLLSDINIIRTPGTTHVRKKNSATVDAMAPNVFEPYNRMCVDSWA